MKKLLIIIGIILSNHLFSQQISFNSVGSYACNQSTLGNITILDGTWIHNKVFLCGYLDNDILNSKVKSPWIGLFDFKTGKLLNEKSWECEGPFNKITSDESTNWVSVSSSGYGQCLNLLFDTNLVEQGSYYNKDFTDNRFFSKIGNNGSFVSIQHAGKYDTPDGYKFRLLLFNNKMEQIMATNYVDSFYVHTAMADGYGSVIAVSQKNNGVAGNDGYDLFHSYQMEIFSLKPDLKNINRKTIPWKVPIKTADNKTYQFSINQLYKIVDPNAKGAGIVAKISFINIDYPNDAFEPACIAYFYMNADGTINESSIVPLVKNDEFIVKATKVLLINGVVFMATYSKATKEVKLVLYNTRTKSNIKTFALADFPDATGASVNDFRDIDDNGLSLLFNAAFIDNTYKFYQVDIK